MVLIDSCNAWVGTELGLVKELNFSNGSFINHGDLKSLDKSQGITAMELLPERDKILIGRKDGSATFFNKCASETPTLLSCGSTPVFGVVSLDNCQLTCSEEGLLKQWRNNECVLEKKIGSNIRTLVCNTNRTLLASGGQENDLKVWDVTNLERNIFAAKNVRNDFLNLRVPVWVSAIKFFQGSDNEIVIGTGNHQIRTYDSRVKRRPVLDVEYHEHPITAISLTKNNKSVLVGNSAGFMGELDLRTGRQVGGFKGTCGSIRDLSCHISQPYVITCSLDRFLRVYNIDTRKLEKKIYLKSNLNRLVLTEEKIDLSDCPDSRKRIKEEELDTEIKQEEEDDDSQTLWESMQVVKEKKRKKIEIADD